MGGRMQEAPVGTLGIDYVGGQMGRVVRAGDGRGTAPGEFQQTGAV